MRISDWSSDVCSSDLPGNGGNGLTWSGRSADDDGFRRVYNGTGGEVIWYVTSMSGPNAGQFFEVTIPAGGAVILTVGDWAHGNVIQVLTSEGGAAEFGSTPVLGDSSTAEVDPSSEERRVGKEG